MTLDTSVLFFLNGLTGKSPAFDDAVAFLAVYLPWLLAGAFLLWLYLSPAPRKEKLVLFLVTALSAIVARFGVTELVRFLYHRPRPFLTFPQLHALFGDSGWSFPSGHAAFFFAMAGAVFCFDRKWGTALLIGAGALSIARVVAGVHYPSDILGGMVIGVAVGYLVFYFAGKWRTNRLY